MRKRIEIMSLLLVFGIVLLALAPKVHAATCTSIGPVWTNPAAWDCGVVPVPADDVIVTNGQVNISVGNSIVRQGATTITGGGASISQNGTLTNYGTFTVDGTLFNNDTIINYGTIVNNGLITNNGSATIINCGTMTGATPTGNPVLPCPSTPPAPSSQTQPVCANDGRVNSICTDPGATAVLYCQPNGDLQVYSVDSQSRGTLSLVVTQQQVEDAGVPEGAAILVAASEDSAIRIYRLSDGSFQLNAPYQDSLLGYLPDGYIFHWQGSC